MHTTLKIKGFTLKWVEPNYVLQVMDADGCRDMNDIDQKLITSSIYKDFVELVYKVIVLLL